MDNQNKVEMILTKKMDDYNTKMNDFVANGEITVTITLSEYRELVESKAKKQYEIDKANSEKWEAKHKAEAMEAELNDLRKKASELQIQLYNATCGKEEATKNG